MKNVRQPWAAEQWFEVTRWINDSAAAVATGKLLCIHWTRNHSFFYHFKLLNIISFQILPTMISKHIGISLELANVQISSAKVMKKHPWCWSLTSPWASAVLWGNTPCQQALLLASPPIPFPHCWLHGHFPLSGQDQSRQSTQNYPFHPAWHYYASDFMDA